MHRWRAGDRAAAGAALGLALASLLLVAQPSYDGWAWLLWGREIGLSGTLDTVEGPAWKPLPVLLTTPLAWTPFPVEGWLVAARAGALLALYGAWRLASWPGLAGAALVAGFWWHGLVGNAEGLFCAALLFAFLLDGRARIACCVVMALLRPEVWPFLLLAIAWSRRWRLLGLAVPVAALWFLPELWGSGDLSRSSDRARVPNPGQPATADRPFLASLELGAGLLFVPVLLGLVWLRDRRLLLLAVFGAAWTVQVAVMAELGYSGEGRYALPGAVALSVAAGAGWRDGWARVRGAAHGRATPTSVALAALAVAALAAFLPARLERHGQDLRNVADESGLWASLPAAIEAAGGREAVLRCGAPVTGRYRGTGLAYALDVPKRTVTFGARDPGVHFRSRMRERAGVSPRSSGRPVLGRSSRWEVRYGPAPCESRPSQ